MVSGRRNNHTIQNLDDSCVHDWYRFVLAYPDHLVRDLIERFGIDQTHTVLDPFVGTGTTLVECKKNGIASVGIDANPVTAFASEVKTNWDIDLGLLASRVRQFLEQVKERIGENELTVVEESQSGQLSFLPVQAETASLELSDDSLLSLIPKGAISKKPLAKVLAIREIIDQQPDDAITDIFRLALATVTVRDMSNLGFGPEIYVKRNKLVDANIYLPLSQMLSKMQHDLETVQHLECRAETRVVCGDARQLADYVHERVDFVITSPPYPNEKDYSRITRLELALLGFVTDRSTLRDVKESMLRSHTRNIYKADNDTVYVKDIPEIVDLADSVEQARIERGATSGFERLYHRVVLEYFGGMHRVFEQLYHVMSPGGKLAIVVGDQKSYFQVPIRTAHLLSLVAQRLDFVELETLVWRTRQATAIKEEIEEHILLLQRV